MSLTTLELKPNRLLLDSNFDGYKLSLQDIKLSRKSLETPVDKTFLNTSQYSLLHARLFGLHNHLFSDRFDALSAVYFVDKELNIQKTYVDSESSELVDPVRVFTIPKHREQKSGDYNVSLCFVNDHYAVASDGMGTLYILATKDKRDDDTFETVFTNKVLENEEQGFIVSDASYKEESNELHVLLLHIQEDPVDRFVSIIYWLTFKQSEDSHDHGKSWGQVALRKLKTKGEVQYLHLEKNCENIYVVSENKIDFLLNSEHPVQKDESEAIEKVYKWTQNLEEINVKFSLPANAQRELIKVSTEPTSIEVAYNTEPLLAGSFSGRIDSALTTWTLESNNILDVTLVKGQGTGMWTELVSGDQIGEYEVDNNLVQQVNDRLQRMTSDTEALPESGATFNSQQIEECDFETDRSETFERISGVTNKTTHRIHLGSHQVLLSPFLTPEHPPALGIRHDVDVCLWQPLIEEDNFTVRHEGTLLAFGYVQASKQNRKFTTCSPNLEYAVISESSGHIFIYRQNKPLLATELRHRATGQRVKTIAQQQVFNLPNQDILGIFAGNSHLFILGDKFILALNVDSNANE